MKYASDHQHFKDAVNACFSNQLRINMNAGETIHDMVASYCDVVSELIIHKVLRDLSTKDDTLEIASRCVDECCSSVREFQQQERIYNSQNIENQMKIEIQNYINEHPGE